MMRMETQVKGRFQVNAPSRVDTPGQVVEVVETPPALRSFPSPGVGLGPCSPAPAPGQT